MEQQFFTIQIERRETRMERRERRKREPVSYTHLDVYKRQAG